MDDEIFNDEKLARRWGLKGTPTAIAKKLQRMRAVKKTSRRHLKSFHAGNAVRYRLVDILDWEAKNATNSLLSLAQYSEDDGLAEYQRKLHIAVDLGLFDKKD